MKIEKEEYCEVICFALCVKVDMNTIASILNKYLEEWEELHGDYLYPKGKPENKFMVEISITPDNYMIVSLTFGSDHREYEGEVLNDLKKFLKTTYGFLSYYQYPVFQSSEDFIQMSYQLNGKNL